MKKQKTITQLITLILSIIISIQVVIILALVIISDVPNKSKNEAINNFSNIINLKSSYFEEQLQSICDLGDYKKIIKNELIDYFGSLDNVRDTSSLVQNQFLKRIPNYLLNILNYNKSQSAYIVLENNEANSNDINRNGIQISRNDDEYVFEIAPNIVQEEFQEIKTNYSKEQFTFLIDNESDNFYFAINRKNEDQILIDRENIGYFSIYKKANEHILSFSYAYSNSKNEVVAIIGFEFKVNDLFEKIKVDSLEPKNCSIIFGYTNNNDLEIVPISAYGKYGQEKIESNNKINILSSTTSNMMSKLGDNNLGLVKKLELYPHNNNPYTNEQFVILGVVNENYLFRTANNFENIIYAIIIITIFFSSLVILASIYYIARPIKSLSVKIRGNNSESPISVEKVNIEEINNVLLSIENVVSQAKNYTNKMSSVINSFLPGVYFYTEEDNDVFCTRPFFDLCDVDYSEGYISKKSFNEIFKKIITSPYDVKYDAYKLNNGKWVKVETKSESTFTLGIISDITNQVEEIQKLDRERDIDPLTKLYNRVVFSKYAEEMLQKNKNKVIAFIMWDIDKLKSINDYYGHDIGDEYIIKFADCIRIINTSSYGIAARRSGDEFFGLIVGDSKLEIVNIIDQIQKKIKSSSITINENTTEKLSASTGISWYPENSTDFKTLINLADIALYEAKYYYKGIVYYINKGKDSAILLHYSKELAKILDGDFVTFAYQPIVNAKDGSVFGYELLMRIFSDIITNPKRLVSIANGESRLDDVEEMTFVKGFESYDNNISNLKESKIFINSVANANLLDSTLNKILAENNNNLDMLVVELSNINKSDSKILSKKIKKFKSVNSQIAIDNFKFEFLDQKYIEIEADYLKIDITLINEIDINLENQEFVKEIIDYAQKNNLKTIAVGVKRYSEMEYLIKQGVDYLQGYYLGEPSAKPSNINKEVISEIRKLNNIVDINLKKDKTN